MWLLSISYKSFTIIIVGEKKDPAIPLIVRKVGKNEKCFVHEKNTPKRKIIDLVANSAKSHMLIPAIMII